MDLSGLFAPLGGSYRHVIPPFYFLGFEIPVLKNPTLESFLQHNKS